MRRHTREGLEFRKEMFLDSTMSHNPLGDVDFICDRMFDGKWVVEIISIVDSITKEDLWGKFKQEYVSWLKPKLISYAISVRRKGFEGDSHDAEAG